MAEVHCLTKIYRELTSEVKTTIFLLFSSFRYSKVCDFQIGVIFFAQASGHIRLNVMGYHVIV